MSLTIFAYALVCSALLAGAAAAVEWGVQGRIATRHLWTAAIVLSMIVPPGALAWRAHATSSRPAVQRAAAGLTHQAISEAPAVIAVANWTVTGQPTPPQTVTAALRGRLSRFEGRISRHVIAAWSVLSLALGVWLVLGTVHWRRARRAWERATIDGVSVDIAPGVGPAVLGVVSQRIVLPAWAIGLAPEQRRLMLAHECEHIAARDPQRLALAVAALVVMPWNAVLWWCAARLRRAIELDCDARVLRSHPMAREYGYLLLEVAARKGSTGALAVPMVGLLQLPSELELRLRAMSRPRTVARRTAAAGGALALIAIAAAFTTPVPRAAWRLTPAPSRTTRPASRRDVRVRGARVLVGRSVLRFDSAVYSPERHTLVAPTRAVRVIELHVGDTIPRARGGDSVEVLARELARKSRELDSTRAQLDSMTAAMHELRALRITSGRVRMNTTTGVADETWHVTTAPRSGREMPPVGEIEAAFARTDGYIASAIAHYYPGLTASNVGANTRIWFVADSAGHVLQTIRDEAQQTMLSAQIASERFKGVAADDIEFVSVRRHLIDGKPISVCWIALKR